MHLGVIQSFKLFLSFDNLSIQVISLPLQFLFFLGSLDNIVSLTVFCALIATPSHLGLLHQRLIFDSKILHHGHTFRKFHRNLFRKLPCDVHFRPPYSPQPAHPDAPGFPFPFLANSSPVGLCGFASRRPCRWPVAGFGWFFEFRASYNHDAPTLLPCSWLSFKYYGKSCHSPEWECQ